MRTVDDLDVLRGFAGGPFDFLVAVMADQQDVEVVLCEAHRFLVDLGDQRAGGVDGAQTPVLRRLDHGRRHAVRRKDHQRTLRHLVRFVDKDGSLFFQRTDHVHVVDNLLADVNRRPIVLQRLFYGDDGPVNAGAVSARGRQQDLLWAGHRRGCQHFLG
jgi:hypothetical protein